MGLKTLWDNRIFTYQPIVSFESEQVEEYIRQADGFLKEMEKLVIRKPSAHWSSSPNCRRRPRSRGAYPWFLPSCQERQGEWRRKTYPISITCELVCLCLKLAPHAPLNRAPSGCSTGVKCLPCGISRLAGNPFGDSTGRAYFTGAFNYSTGA